MNLRHRTLLKIFVGALILPALTFVSTAASAAGPKSCDSLASLKLPDATITSATSVAAGNFAPPAPPGAANAPRPIQVPAFCRVQLTVSPSIAIEVWLPASGWNGNFEGVGNMGYAGTIIYGAMGAALQMGYATASTDTGHQGGNPNFALNRPDLIVDFGYRAIHEMTIKTKQLIAAFYGDGPKVSYFNGCSTGGRQGQSEAQLYPEDYNGILSGAPASEWPHLQYRAAVSILATLKDDESYIPPTKLAAIQDASLAACDTLDGLEDGLIDDPRKCKFDTSVLLCKGADSDTCLTAKQLAALNTVYADVKYPDGKEIYPAYMPGTEKGWNLTTGAAPGRSAFYNLGVGYMRFFVYNDPNWDYHNLNIAKDMPAVDNEKTRAALDSMNSNLNPFRDHGGKLIMYQGWGDDAVSPLHTINYYKSAVAVATGVGKGSNATTPESASFDKAAQQAGNFFRLFMVPGMNHCGGGSGPNVFDGFTALVNWVEKKQPPEQIVASHSTSGTVDRTRPLCPYPQTAQYTGTGSIDDAANFVCKLPQAK